MQTFSGQQVLNTMEESLFCIVLPGDAQSTRRLSEVFMGGSIPVFIGPPYHSMPFADYVDYRHACSTHGSGLLVCLPACLLACLRWHLFA